MFYAKCDVAVLKSREMEEIAEEYKIKFGDYPDFNYIDFQRDGNRSAAVVFRDKMKECIEKGTPYIFYFM